MGQKSVLPRYGSTVIGCVARNGRDGALVAHVQRAPRGRRCFCGNARTVTLVEITDELDTFSETRCAVCGAAQLADGTFVPAAPLDVPIVLWPQVGS